MEADGDGEGGQGGEGPDQFLSSVCGTAEEDLEKTETQDFKASAIGHVV